MLRLILCLLCLSGFGLSAPLLADGTKIPPDTSAEIENKALNLFFFDFERDRDWDKLPDLWERRQGKEYTHYFTFDVDPKVSSHGKYSLRFNAEKGKAEAISRTRTPLLVDPYATYTLSVKIRQRHAPRSQAWFGLSFYDKEGKFLSSHKKMPKAYGLNWEKSEEIIDRVPPKAYSMRISLGVDSQDINGNVWFDEVYLHRYPRIALTGTPFLVYNPDQAVVLEANIGGLKPSSPHELYIRIHDFDNKPVSQIQRTLQSDKDGLTNKTLSFPIIKSGFYQGQAVLKHNDIQVAQSGFFFTHISARTPHSNEHSAQGLGLGNYGLILPADTPRDDVNSLTYTLPIRHIKWLFTLEDLADPLKTQQHRHRLGALDNRPIMPHIAIAASAMTTDSKESGTKQIKAFDHYIKELTTIKTKKTADEKKEALPAKSPTAKISAADKELNLLDPLSAKPVPVEPILTIKKDMRTPNEKLNFILGNFNDMINAWQFGWDDSKLPLSLSPSPKPLPDKRIPELQKIVSNYTFDTPITLPLEINSANQTPRISSKYSHSLFVPKQMSPKELDTYLGSLKNIQVAMPATKKNKSSKTAPPVSTPLDKDTVSITIETLPGQGQFRKQVADFIKKAVLAQRHGFHHIYPWPLQHPQTSLFNHRNEAGPLFSAYLTLNRALAGATYYDDLQRGDFRELFFNDTNGNFVMVGWSPKDPITDVLQLGANVKVFNLMGDFKSAPNEGKKQKIILGPLPTFYINVNDELVKTRMSFKLRRQDKGMPLLPLALDVKKQKQIIEMQNHFDRSARVIIWPKYPVGWIVQPPRIVLNLAGKGKPGERQSQTFHVIPPIDQDSDRIRSTFDIDLFADQEYELTIKRLFDAKATIKQTVTHRFSDNNQFVEISQIISNQTGQALKSLSAFIKLPGYVEKTYEIPPMEAGAEQRRNYRFSTKQIDGQPLRIGVREYNGTRFNNTYLTINAP